MFSAKVSIKHSTKADSSLVRLMCGMGGPLMFYPSLCGSLRRQQAQLFLDPDLSTVKVLLSDGIVTQQKATTNHAIRDMHNGHSFG